MSHGGVDVSVGDVREPYGGWSEGPPDSCRAVGGNAWCGKVGPEFRPPAVKAQGQGRQSRAEPVQCQSSCAQTQLLPLPFLSLTHNFLLAAPSTKDKQRVGMVLCPSPPSGAACLCQDVSLHIVMKGVIKVTAGWNAACYHSSLPLSLFISPSLVPHIVCQCRAPVISNHHIFSSKGSVSVSSGGHHKHQHQLQLTNGLLALTTTEE